MLGAAEVWEGLGPLRFWGVCPTRLGTILPPPSLAIAERILPDAQEILLRLLEL